MENRLKIGDSAQAAIRTRRDVDDGLGIRGHVRVVCRGKSGAVKWVEEGDNIVVDTGIDYIFNTDLAAASNFVGLLKAGTPDNTWTMTEAGATANEAEDYSSGTRPAWTVVDSTAQSVTNAASVASFAINGTVTVTGAFLSTSSAKDTTGTLIAAKLFAASRAVESGDTLEVTYSISGSST